MSDIKGTRDELVLLDLLANKIITLYETDKSCITVTIHKTTLGDLGDVYDTWVDEEESAIIAKKVGLSKNRYIKNVAISYKHEESIDTINTIVNYIVIDFDAITDIFNLKMDVVEIKDKNTSHNSSLHSSLAWSNKSTKTVRSSINFEFKYRNETRLIKMKLLKIYKEVKEYEKMKNIEEIRSSLSSLSMQIFPDIMDPLILGDRDYEITK